MVIWYILAVIEVVLGLRMLFKALGANPFSGFVSIIYSISDILLLPFSGIFPASKPSNIPGASGINPTGRIICQMFPINLLKAFD